MRKRIVNSSLKFLVLDGKVYVGLWSLVALVRFAMGLPVDAVFIAVLGIYAGHRIADTVSSNMADKSAK